jgi:hypothetical protein
MGKMRGHPSCREMALVYPQLSSGNLKGALFLFMGLILVEYKLVNRWNANPL